MTQPAHAGPAEDVAVAAFGSTPSRSSLFTDFKDDEYVEVSLRIDLFEGIQQASSAANEHQQARRHAKSRL